MSRSKRLLCNACFLSSVLLATSALLFSCGDGSSKDVLYSCDNAQLEILLEADGVAVEPHSSQLILSGPQSIQGYSMYLHHWPEDSLSEDSTLAESLLQKYEIEQTWTWLGLELPEGAVECPSAYGNSCRGVVSLVFNSSYLEADETIDLKNSSRVSVRIQPVLGRVADSTAVGVINISSDESSIAFGSLSLKHDGDKIELELDIEIEPLTDTSFDNGNGNAEPFPALHIKAIKTFSCTKEELEVCG